MSTITLRATTAEDLPLLAALYRDAVQTQGPAAYSPAHVAVWQDWPVRSPDEFGQRLTAGHTWLATVDGEPAAFATFTPPDHLDFLYTAGRFAGRGLATRLHAQLESIARDSGATLLRTEASHLSRPVFARFGYEVFAPEDVTRGALTFHRYRMRKFLGNGPPATTLPAPCRQAHVASFPATPTVPAETNIHFEAMDPQASAWFRGRDAHGVAGYFPAAWFDLDPPTHRATARRDYSAHELTVAAGDPVGIIEIHAGWARVRTSTGEIGWIAADAAPPDSTA